jgi:hypothetical protein
MKRSAFAVVLLLALADVSSAQTPPPAVNVPAEGTKMTSPDKTGDVALAADRSLPSNLDPRVCLEFSSAAQVIACAEKYRLRKRHA